MKLRPKVPNLDPAASSSVIGFGAIMGRNATKEEREAMLAKMKKVWKERYRSLRTWQRNQLSLECLFYGTPQG